MHRIEEIKYALLPIAIVVVSLVGLILLEPDFGTSVSLALIAAVMVFSAGLNYRYVVGVVLLALPTVYLVVMGDRKSTRLNSSHMSISYAVFCLKKKKKK